MPRAPREHLWQVSFMPELLANDTTHTVFHYKGILSPPKSFSDWRDFMAAFASVSHVSRHARQLLLPPAFKRAQRGQLGTAQGACPLGGHSRCRADDRSWIGLAWIRLPGRVGAVQALRAGVRIYIRGRVNGDHIAWHHGRCRARTQALIERYGAEEVHKWYFETWNEPNCCGGYVRLSSHTTSIPPHGYDQTSIFQIVGGILLVWEKA